MPCQQKKNKTKTKAVNNQHGEKCNQSSNCQLLPWINTLFLRKETFFFFFWSLLSHVKRGIGRDLQLLMQLIIVAGLFTFLAHLQKHKAEIVVTVKLKSGCCSGSVIAFYLIEVSLKQDTLHLQRELEANTLPSLSLTHTEACFRLRIWRRLCYAPWRQTWTMIQVHRF